ncbi:MAG: CheW protein [Anaerocolumna sp.]|jgi:purine-binding chemotaxis protein CheW|nr:CheW protein [Anaerocolumna sp.]
MEANSNIIDGKQYIVVKLGNEQYGIDINFVDNIVRMQRITRVPKAQHYFKGVINLRGEIIPVMSIRLKFGLEEDQITNATRIIIIKFDAGSAVGIIVDEVKEVVTLEESNISRINSELGDKNGFLNGIGKHGDDLISLLNISSVIIEKETN